MKVKLPQLVEKLQAPGPDIRFFLLYGPDEAGSRALVRKLAAAMGEDAERIDLTGAELRADPARLPDEAASIALFGGARYVVVDPAGAEVLGAVEALLEAPAAGNPVVLVAGALAASSPLVKLATASDAAIAYPSYVPEARDADRLVTELAHEHGLSVRREVARRIGEAAGGNRAIVEQELAKFALYLDAGPDRPKTLEEDVVALLGAGEEGDLGRLVDSVATGDAAGLDAELRRLPGLDPIPLLRTLARRFLLIARLRAQVERGSNVGAVMASQGKAIFWKDRDMVAAQVARWPSALLAKAISRLLEAERQVMAPNSIGETAVREELFAICRQAARLR